MAVTWSAWLRYLHRVIMSLVVNVIVILFNVFVMIVDVVVNIMNILKETRTLCHLFIFL